jgi:hypothetical protein
MRRVTFIASLLSSLAIVAVLAGCGAGATAATSTATATTAATPTPLLNAIYSSTDGGYKISYPGAWKVEPLTIPSTSGTAQIESDNGTDLVLIEPFTIKSAMSYPSILTSAISVPPFTNSKVESAVTTQTVPSGNWTVASGTTEANGTALTVHLYGTLHNDHTFIIITFAPTSSAATDQATFLDPMFLSFTFLT